jgi:serine/threonine protein kinase
MDKRLPSKTINHADDDYDYDDYDRNHLPNLMQPPKNDWKTPPLQTNLTFTEMNMMNSNNELNSPTSKFGDIHNLPTPIVVNNSNTKSSFTFSSPKLSQDHVFQNQTNNKVPVLDNSGNAENPYNSPLVISKIRQKSPIKRRSILMDSNISPIEEHRDKPKRFISDFKIKDRNVSNLQINSTPNDLSIESLNVNNSNNFYLQNIKPVDRVVSLPMHQHYIFTNDNKSENKRNDLRKPLQTDIIPESSERKENLAHPLHLVTYSVDGDLRLQHWNICNEIGSGSFSKVYLADDGITALKVTDISFNKDSDKNEELNLRIQNSLTRELQILKSLNHPNIIKLIGTDYKNDFENDLKVNKITMAIEYCEGGDLYSFVLDHRQQMSPELIRYIFANIVSAVSFIHDLNICHRDIKLENILLKYLPNELIHNNIELSQKKLPILVLSDFGLSKKIDPLNPLLSTRCGSEDYVSPELLLGMSYDGKQNDCWSTGVVLYTILEGRLPFDPLPTERNKPLRRQSKPSHRIAMISWNWYFMKDEVLGEIFKQPKEIVKMLLTKRNKRATMNDIKNHPWCKPYIIQPNTLN